MAGECQRTSPCTPSVPRPILREDSAPVNAPAPFARTRARHGSASPREHQRETIFDSAMWMRRAPCSLPASSPAPRPAAKDVHSLRDSQYWLGVSVDPEHADNVQSVRASQEALAQLVIEIELAAFPGVLETNVTAGQAI